MQRTIRHDHTLSRYGTSQPLTTCASRRSARCARTRSADGTRLAPMTYRSQDSRTWSWSASRQRGMQCISRHGHARSRYSTTQPPTTRASRRSQRCARTRSADVLRLAPMAYRQQDSRARSWSACRHSGVHRISRHDHTLSRVQRHPTTDDTCLETLTEVRTYAIS